MWRLQIKSRIMMHYFCKSAALGDSQQKMATFEFFTTFAKTFLFFDGISKFKFYRSAKNVGTSVIFSQKTQN